MAADPRDLVPASDAMSWIPVTNASEQVFVQQLVTMVSEYLLARTGRTTLNAILPFNETYDGSGSGRLFLRNAPILSVTALSINGVSIPASTGYNMAGYVVDASRESISLRGGIGSGIFLSPSGTGSYAQQTASRFKGPVFSYDVQNVNVSYFAGQSILPAELQTVPGSPFQVTVANAANFALDLGVLYQTTGVALVGVASSPAQGQYSVSNVGVYTFNSADANAKVVISYGYNAAPLDLQIACKRMVALIYKRKPQEDLKAKMLTEGGTTSFRDWVCPPEVEATIRKYKRMAFV